ncbi:HD domain-containing protein [Deinococcus yavapaiensis]|uniref:Putative metal-dependent HD superfamily phosphohydrolase n=1 Tax=Deinococcus yavapaiensis KR-236 TaxID=694435 RepID=A0A318SK16_9DEIO|nr:hypothetical protein [Deinococcus yavapaiensis]PYE52898.1 putative metal-dependent HD superfamily phosphohydrolase [Deinococcus yavapaiensis KR-236]
MTDARSRWMDVESRLGRQPELFAELVARYAEPHRAYHDLSHVLDVLNALDRLPLQDPLAVTLAAWFHDAVYDSRASDNEERSADLAVANLSKSGLAFERVEKVAALILATKRHGPTHDPDTRALLDADLAILGSPSERYDVYARAIRREYAWVPDEEYRAGRGRVLEEFLARDRLYQTTSLFVVLEGPARHNLARELAVLTRIA